MKASQANTQERPYPHYKFPHEIIITVKPMSESQCSWFNVPFGSYELRCDNYGWFPMGVLMGVIEGKYSDTNNLGACISGNMGTASISVLDVNRAVCMLREQGYNVTHE